VTLRTLYRDVATLREQGAAIAGEPGVGYVLRPGFLLPPLMFSADELEALLLGARWVSLQADPELARAADGALTRIASTLPADARLGLETSGLMVPQSGTPAAPGPGCPRCAAPSATSARWCCSTATPTGRPRRTVWPFAMGFPAVAHAGRLVRAAPGLSPLPRRPRAAPAPHRRAAARAPARADPALEGPVAHPSHC
jgi:hypothetical protein